MRTNLLLLFLMLLSSQLIAEIRPSLLVADHMVLQRNAAVPIWGWADKGEKVTVQFNGQTHTAKPDKNGKWMVTFNPMSAGGPYEMTLTSSKSNITVSNVMIGEVWLCSGQSNMEWILANTEHAKQEIDQADYPLIRHFKVERRVSPAPFDRLESGVDSRHGQWELCTPKTASDFTAVGYYYAKELHQKLGVAIGLINASWGGTVVETWMSSGAAKQFPEFEEKLAKLQRFNLDNFIEEQKKFNAEQTQVLKEKLGGTLPTADEGLVNGDAIWANPEFDDQDWKTMKLPSLWEEQGLNYLDGVVWLRKEITLSADFVREGATLHLAKIDDSDISWVNGTQVGAMTDSYDKQRVYAVESAVLKAGKNVITVRVEDTRGGGGIWGSPRNLKLVSDSGEEISLVGNWKYNVGIGIANVPIYTSFPPNSHPTLLYNGMIKALIPYGIKGAIWYQGESNASRAYQYRSLFPQLIKDWRSKWNQGDFPFLFVQLANYQSAQPQPGESTWAELREAQSMTLALPHTGQAVIIDIGEADDIHPRNKKDVGKRLALNARKVAYGEEIVHSGPVYDAMTVEGNTIKIKFKHVGGGLVAKDKYGYLKSFAIAGADQKFVWAKAEIVGDDIVVYSESVSKPVAVRYAWANNPDDANLYNAEGLPASPFRTDSWDGITKKN